MGDLVNWYKPRIAGHVRLLGEDVDDVVNVLIAEAVLRAILSKSFRGVDHEHAPATGGVLLVEHHDAGGGISALEEGCGGADDPPEGAGEGVRPSDRRFPIAAEEDAPGDKAGGCTR